MRTITRLLFPRQQLYHEAKPRKIVVVEGDNKLGIIEILSRFVFYYTEENIHVICR